MPDQGRKKLNLIEKKHPFRVCQGDHNTKFWFMYVNLFMLNLQKQGLL